MQKRRKYCARAARVQRFSLQLLSNQYYLKSLELNFHQFPAVFGAVGPLRVLPAHNFQHADKMRKMTSNAKKSIAGSYPTLPTKLFPTVFQNRIILNNMSALFWCFFLFLSLYPPCECFRQKIFAHRKNLIK